MGGDATDNMRARHMESESLLQAAQLELQEAQLGLQEAQKNVSLRDEFILSKGLTDEFLSWSFPRVATMPYVDGDSLGLDTEEEGAPPAMEKTPSELALEGSQEGMGDE